MTVLNQHPTNITTIDDDYCDGSNNAYTTHKNRQQQHQQQQQQQHSHSSLPRKQYSKNDMKYFSRIERHQTKNNEAIKRFIDTWQHQGRATILDNIKHRKFININFANNTNNPQRISLENQNAVYNPTYGHWDKIGNNVHHINNNHGNDSNNTTTTTTTNYNNSAIGIHSNTIENNRYNINDRGSGGDDSDVGPRGEREGQISTVDDLSNHSQYRAIHTPEQLPPIVSSSFSLSSSSSPSSSSLLLHPSPSRSQVSPLSSNIHRDTSASAPARVYIQTPTPSYTENLMRNLNPFSNGMHTVTITIAILTLLVSFLYMFRWLTILPCGTGFMSTLLRNFIHLDTMHLISNLFFLLIFANRIESRIGASRFLILSGLIFSLQTVIEWVVENTVHVRCSIGLSGFIFGLFSWEILYNRGNLSLQTLLSIAAAVLISSFPLNKISLLGHAIGAVSGLIAVPIYKMIFNNESGNNSGKNKNNNSNNYRNRINGILLSGENQKQQR